MSKQDIIAKIYFNESGYGSKQRTLKESREKDKTIAMTDVEEFFRKNVEQKKQLRGYNRFVSPHPFFEFQVDLFFINDLEKQNYRVGMTIIDTFSRYMVIIPIKSKGEGDVAAGLIEGLNKFEKRPQIIYSDDEKALSTDAIQKYLKDEGIYHHITRGHANFSERAIRSFKDALYKRIDNDLRKDKSKNIQWTDYIHQVVLTYNTHLKHSGIGMTPKEALKKDNHLKAKIEMATKANKTRKYPELKGGSEVKVYRKKAIAEKERSSTWSGQKYTVERIETKLGQEYYKTSQGSRWYLRHELLKVYFTFIGKMT